MAENRFRFTNEKCPVCENAFSGDDDIVVCPICGTPHHRECYKQNGKCKNENQHSSGFRWEPIPLTEEKPQPEPEFQQKTRTNNSENDDANPFSYFGFPPPPQNNPLNLFPANMEDDITTMDVATFVQQDAVKYIQKFFYVKGKKRTINWAALFFAPYWFFYRKMYKLGAIFMAIQLLISCLSLLPPAERLYEATYDYQEQVEILNVSDLTSDETNAALTELSQKTISAIKGNYLGAGIVIFQSVSSLAVTVFIGLNANKWYYKHVTTEIRKINQENPDKEKRATLLYKSGGVSYGIAFLSVLVEKIFIYGIDLISMMFFH